MYASAEKKGNVFCVNLIRIRDFNISNCWYITNGTSDKSYKQA